MSETVKTKGKTAAQLRKQRILRKKLLRAGIQIFFFLAMPGAFVAGYNGISSIFDAIGAGAVLQLDNFVLALIGLCLFTILFGRFFCGYVCAFGSLGDLVRWISVLIQTKIFHRKKPIGFSVKLLRILQKLKYANLAFIIIMSILALYSMFDGSSVWDVFSRWTSFQAVPEGYTIGIVTFFLVLVGMALQERFFCQILCPLGAVFSLLPVFPFAQLQRNPDVCLKGCDACRRQCPVGIKLEPDGIRNGECITCEKCTAICPKNNIRRTEQRILKNEYLSVVIRAALFFAMGCWLGLCRFL